MAEEVLEDIKIKIKSLDECESENKDESLKNLLVDIKLENECDSFRINLQPKVTLRKLEFDSSLLHQLQIKVGDVLLESVTDIEARVNKSNNNHHENTDRCQESEQLEVGQRRSRSKRRNYKKLHSGDKQFNCNVCRKSFKGPTPLEVHMRTHTGNKPFKCLQCAYSGTQADHLKLHVISRHSGEKPHDCPRCDFKSARFSSLYNHMRLHSKKKRHVCKICDKSFSLSHRLNKHEQTHVKDQVFECSQCEYSVSRVDDLIRHTESHRTGRKPSSCPRSGFKTEKSGSLHDHVSSHSEEKSHVCAVCVKSFRGPNALRVHMRTHSVDKPFNCSECFFSSAQANQLKLHSINNHSGKKLFALSNSGSDRSEKRTRVCNVREKSFKLSSDLLEHEQTPIWDESFNCSDCLYSTNNKRNLKHHIMALHSGERPVACSQCDYTTVRSDKLRIHMTLHNRTKRLRKGTRVKSTRFKCHYACSYAFNCRSKLTEHVRLVHLGGKIWKRLTCPYCDYKTNECKSLTIHIRSHTGERPFGCAHCEFKSSTKKTLIDHLRSHLGVKPFKCALCAFAAINRNQIKSHIDRIHSKEAEVACPKCGVTTIRRRLKQHMFSHSSRKTIACDWCDMKFTNLFEMDRHKNVHTKEKMLVCDRCSFRTVHKSSMKRHTMAHTGELLVSCDHCSYRTRYKHTLKRHIMRKHSGPS